MYSALPGYGRCLGHICGAGAAEAAADAAVCSDADASLWLLQGWEGRRRPSADAFLSANWLRSAHLADALSLSAGRQGQSVAAAAPLRHPDSGRGRHSGQCAGLQIWTQQVEECVYHIIFINLYTVSNRIPLQALTVPWRALLPLCCPSCCPSGCCSWAASSSWPRRNGSPRFLPHLMQL